MPHGKNVVVFAIFPTFVIFATYRAPVGIACKQNSWPLYRLITSNTCRMEKILCLASLSLLLLMGCRTHKSAPVVSVYEGATDTVYEWNATNPTTAAAMPPVIVYKTTRDYKNNVPVILNAAGTQIVSYPDPSDLRRGDSFTTPTQLDNGYLLDNRGISKNTAFLDYTYEQYAALDTIPPLDEMMRHVIDKKPIVEMWYCGQVSQYQDKIKELNELIARGFPGCTKVVDNPVLPKP